MGPPKTEKYKLQCEWGQCRKSYEDMESFYKHLDEHFWADIAAASMEPGCTLLCQWCECNFVTTNGHDLIRHLYFHGFHTKLKWLGFLKHQEANSGECQINQNRNIIPELPDGFKCCWEDCFIVVDVPDKYYDHVREHAALSDPETLPNGKKGFKCHWEGCGYEYAFESKALSLGRHKLRGHMTTHTQERCYACPWCGNLYVNKTKLIDHYTRQMNVENHSFQCTHCSRTFASERILKDHMRHHVNHYQCPKCAMTCPNPSALKHHIRYKHSTERPYACEFCEYRSKESHDLQTHMQFHQSDLSYHCQVDGCDYVVRSIQNLRYHYRVKHGSGDGKLYACHLCDKTYGTGYQLTHHLRKLHNFQWPPGHCRFRYKECEDGMFRLQIFRYESIELTKQIVIENPSTSDDTDTANEASTSAHIRPTIVARMNVERKKKAAATRKGTGHPSRNVTKIRRNIGKSAPVATRKSTRRTKQKKVENTTNSKEIVKAPARKSRSANDDATIAENLNSDLPDLYFNTECLEAADTLCTMKSNSAKKRKRAGTATPETDDIPAEQPQKAALNGEETKVNEASTRRNSTKKLFQQRGRLVKAKKRLLLTSKVSSPRKSRKTDATKVIKDCSVDVIPLENPVFPDHHKLYHAPCPLENQLHSQPGTSETDLVELNPTSSEISPNAEDSSTSADTSTPILVAPTLCEKEGAETPTTDDVTSTMHTDGQLTTLEAPQFVGFDDPASSDDGSTFGNDLHGVGVPLEPASSDDEGKLVEVNRSEIVTDDDGNRTVVNVGGEEYYLVSGNDTTSGSTVYCLVELSKFTEER